ncbi:unnamed protein product [Didymodactylos carnosus]|uniref:Uncharacterized protein n=1 Tax=Didymodactylos carnosus TaxID=1234261 RepID=A0A814N047_9BILA|nr:unnamed protein product [Didymodactylos carnosus]CAF1085396.1 unnamed protein product [Didymodactylos carnosus]CAF3679430.1 unnamed protein product [Didymodactylos carnosus]CAF3850986.1 unnamed protein product [Didymodactylos carnosus]
MATTLERLSAAVVRNACVGIPTSIIITDVNGYSKAFEDEEEEHALWWSEEFLNELHDEFLLGSNDSFINSTSDEVQKEENIYTLQFETEKHLLKEILEEEEGEEEEENIYTLQSETEKHSLKEILEEEEQEEDADIEQLHRVLAKEFDRIDAFSRSHSKIPCLDDDDVTLQTASVVEVDIPSAIITSDVLNETLLSSSSSKKENISLCLKTDMLRLRIRHVGGIIIAKLRSFKLGTSEKQKCIVKKSSI